MKKRSILKKKDCRFNIFFIAGKQISSNFFVGRLIIARCTMRNVQCTLYTIALSCASKRLRTFQIRMNRLLDLLIFLNLQSFLFRNKSISSSNIRLKYICSCFLSLKISRSSPRPHYSLPLNHSPLITLLSHCFRKLRNVCRLIDKQKRLGKEREE